MKGLKLQPQPSKKDQLRSLDTELKNAQMANRMTQLLVQQMMSNMKSMSDDMTAAMAQLYELQYKYEALRSHLNVDTSALNSAANGLRLKDFEDAAAKADSREGLFDVDSATEHSIVVLTSTAQDEQGVDKGIFRSRIKLSESGSPDLIKSLVGKKVGEKTTVTLNGLVHTVELLSVKSEPTQKTELSH